MFKPVTQDVVEIAERLIVRHHPKLNQARIGLLFRKEAPNSKGRITLGQAKLVSPDVRAAGLNYDFIIWFAKDRWDLLNADQRVALVDHELCHCEYDEDEGKASMRGHDYEEFVQIIERHGFWLPGEQRILQAVQLHLMPMSERQSIGRGAVEAIAREFESIHGVTVEYEPAASN